MTVWQPRGLLAATLALGWGVLAEVADREIVVGAVTKPWEPNVDVPCVTPGRVRRLRRARVRQDRLDLAHRSDPRRNVDLPNGDPGARDRCDRPRQIPTVLGVRLAWHRADSPALSSTAARRGRAARADRRSQWWMSGWSIAFAVRRHPALPTGRLAALERRGRPRRRPSPCSARAAGRGRGDGCARASARPVARRPRRAPCSTQATTAPSMSNVSSAIGPPPQWPIPGTRNRRLQS